jgi:hypothetical protein
VFGSVLPSQDDIHPELPINAVIRFFMAGIYCSSIIADDRNTTMFLYAHHIGAMPLISQRSPVVSVLIELT